MESFNGTLRAECLDVHWFVTLTEAKQIIEDWSREYSESRPHRSLGERTPSELTNPPKTRLESVTEKGGRSRSSLSYAQVSGTREQVSS